MNAPTGYTPLGVIGFSPKGDYNSSATYVQNDIVRYNGNQYRCKVDDTTGIAPTNQTRWELWLHGGEGHIIVDDAGDAYTQRNNLKFAEMKVADDPTNDQTVVRPANIHTSTSDPGEGGDLASNNLLIVSDGPMEPAKKMYVGINDKAVNVPLGGEAPKYVYGVEWDGSADSSWTRTDDSASFSDPQPYYTGKVETPSSPFDRLMPWAGMQKATRSCGTMVSIPKFYYKLQKTTTGLKLQIAPAENGSAWAIANDFKVSPAHMDRGDGKGERDAIYVSRYLCSASDYKSTTGATAKNEITRSVARQGIHNLGADIWQFDYATLVTIWMLYLVEFADWNSQAKIGGGCFAETESIVSNAGYTDSMLYHTGTMATSISASVGGGMQYRYIEGLWSNIYTWVDGVYFNGTNVYSILNPANFSDTTGGVLVGTCSNERRFIRNFGLSNVYGYDWFMIPDTTGASNTTYICDEWGYDSNGVGMYTGGALVLFGNDGLFKISREGAIASYTAEYIGCRCIELP